MANQKEPNKSSENIGAGEQQSQPSEESESRRRAIRRLLVGGGLVAGAQLPQKWARPVVDTVLLPAHAAGSPPSSPPSSPPTSPPTSPPGSPPAHMIEEGNPFTLPQPNPFAPTE